MRGNDKQRQAEQRQEWEFPLSMDRADRIKAPRSPEPLLRVSLFECLRDRQPATAWTLGQMAGWEEMRNGGS